MTYPQFEQWLRHHIAAYPGLQTSYLAKMKRASDASRGEWEPSREEVLAAWFKALGDVALDDAKAATDAMKAGDEEEPKGWDRHATGVAVIARRRATPRSRELTIDGQRTVRCLHCQDTGRVVCWGREAMQQARDGKPIAYPHYRTTLLCNCGAAARFHAANGYVRFDETLHLPIQKFRVNDPDAHEELREFVAGIVPANHETAFDQFGG